MKISRSLCFVSATLILLILALAACAPVEAPVASVSASEAQVAAASVDPANLQTATFAGGCFWSMQRMMDEVAGVITTTVGYAGGEEVNPTYEQVAAEITGHAESVEVTFDSSRISYEELLDAYWHDIDPMQVEGQACDWGHSYRSIIFYQDAEQQRLAEASKAALEASGRFSEPIVVTIEPVAPFYPAEEYHQKFYIKNPEHYAAYRAGCGRDERLAQIWGTAPQ